MATRKKGRSQLAANADTIRKYGLASGGSKSQAECQKLAATVTTRDLLEMGMWRPSASMEIIAHMAAGRSVLIRGRAGCGKGAVLTGAWRWAESVDLSHTFLDGHYQSTPDDMFVEAIKRQAGKGAVFFDSTDYLYAGPRKVRRVSKEKHRERTRRLLDALDTVPVIVGTMHEEAWRRYLGDPELYQMFDDFFATRDVVVYDVDEQFETRELAYSFLLNKGIEPVYANALVDVEFSPTARRLFFDRWPSKVRWGAFLWLMRTYATLKLIAQDVYDEHIPLQALMREETEEEFWPALFEYVFAKDYRLTMHPVVVRMK